MDHQTQSSRWMPIMWAWQFIWATNAIFVLMQIWSHQCYQRCQKSSWWVLLHKQNPHFVKTYQCCVSQSACVKKKHTWHHWHQTTIIKHSRAPWQDIFVAIKWITVNYITCNKRHFCNVLLLRIVRGVFSSFFLPPFEMVLVDLSPWSTCHFGACAAPRVN